MGFCGRLSLSWFVDDRVDIDDAVRSWAKRLRAPEFPRSAGVGQAMQGEFRGDGARKKSP